MSFIISHVNRLRKIRFSAEKPRRLQVSTGHLPRAAFRIRPPNTHYAEKDQSERIGLFLVGEDGFDPSKRYAADLQSVPFGHSGTPPYIHFVYAPFGAGRRTRSIKDRLGLSLAGNSPPDCYILIVRVSLSICSGGAGRRTRTPDLLITNQLLYQLSYTGGSNRTRLL